MGHYDNCKPGYTPDDLRKAAAKIFFKGVKTPKLTNRKRIIFSVSGLISSGKDTIGSRLINQYGFKRMSFSASMKDAVAAIFGFDRGLLDGITEEGRKWRETVDPWWTEKLNFGIDITPRWLMQNFATDVMRDKFHPDIWTLSLERQLDQYDGDVVLTDPRYLNEINLVKQKGGVVCGVHRKMPHWVEKFYSHMDRELATLGLTTKDFDFRSPIDRDLMMATIARARRRAGIEVHESELVHLTWNRYDYVFDNTRSLDALTYDVDLFLDMLRRQPF